VPISIPALKPQKNTGRPKKRKSQIK